jgi:2'-deoxynucleoside 5'-phosphate N-hydrolase
MKVFFTASQRGKQEFGKYYEKIISTVKTMGFSMIEDDLFSYTQSSFYKRLDKGGRQAQIDLYREKIDHIRQADITIFECTIPSLGIGYVVEKSLSFNKPTIILYFKNNEPYFLEGVEDEKLIIKSYSDSNIKKVLVDAMNLARERRDKRFNFFISPKLLEYLEEASKKTGITKSTFIRNLILDHKKQGQVR